jgi:hypothetical protein
MSTGSYADAITLELLQKVKFHVETWYTTASQISKPKEHLLLGYFDLY